MADNKNGIDRKAALPLNVLNEDELEDGEDTFIVVGEKDDDVAFEVCEDLEIALGVRDAMQEDGFKVRMYAANEIEVVEEEIEAPGKPAR